MSKKKQKKATSSLDKRKLSRTEKLKQARRQNLKSGDWVKIKPSYVKWVLDHAEVFDFPRSMLKNDKELLAYLQLGAGCKHVGVVLNYNEGTKCYEVIWAVLATSDGFSSNEFFQASNLELDLSIRNGYDGLKKLGGE